MLFAKVQAGMLLSDDGSAIAKRALHLLSAGVGIICMKGRQRRELI
jgi:hypothetical protein